MNSLVWSSPKHQPYPSLRLQKPFSSSSGGRLTHSYLLKNTQILCKPCCHLPILVSFSLADLLMLILPNYIDNMYLNALQFSTTQLFYLLHIGQIFIQILGNSLHHWINTEKSSEQFERVMSTKYTENGLHRALENQQSYIYIGNFPYANMQ